MKIAVRPSPDRKNKYMELITDALRQEGQEVYWLEEVIRKPALLREIKLVHLNWIENINSQQRSIVVKKFLVVCFRLFGLRLLGKKIVWTMHNKLPHDPYMSWLKLRLMKMIIRLSHGIVIHTETSRQILMADYKVPDSKIFYCPHPNYINAYGGIIKGSSKKSGTSLKLLFLGAVRPYKNIELLIEVMQEMKNEQVELLVAGKVASEDYAASLREKAGNHPNIKLDLRFIPDTEIPVLMSNCDLLVFPYDRRSTLNSGSAILAFSYGKTLICPRIEALADMGCEAFFFTYDYESREEHKQRLSESIREALKEYEFLDRYGEELLRYVDKFHGKKEVGRCLSRIYERVGKLKS